jgi:TPR repeat protein
MEVKANLVGTTSNRLWRSARFFRQDVSLVTLPAVGQFRLTLDVDEVREAPSLHQEFSPKAQAMLKFRDWLAGWETRPEDFTFSITFSNSWLHQQADIAFSPSGLAVVFRAPSSNSPAKPTYAIVTSDNIAGIYSIWRQSKFAIRAQTLNTQVILQFRPPSPRSYGNGNIHIAMGVGIPHSQPYRLELDLQPAVFVSMADWKETTLKDGVLTLRDPGGTNSDTLRIEAATGRLLEYFQKGELDGGDSFTVRLQAEEGALARLSREIASATADHPNRFVTNRAFASWVSSMATDALESPLLEPAIEALTSHEESASGAPLVVSSAARWIKPALMSARETLHEGRLSTLLEPLTRIFSNPTEEDVEKDVETFTVPADDLTAPGATNPMAAVGSWVLHWSDTVLPRGSWPWVLLREATFTVAGEDRYSTGELEKLLKSEEVGPAGCLATALLLGRVRPPLAREFAEHGLARLNPKALHGDFKVLLHTNSVVGALAGNVLGWLGDLSEAQLSPLSAGLAPAGMEFMRQLARRIAETKGQPPGEAAWPVLEQHWDSVLRPALELGLNRFLPQVQFLTNSQALYERGLALVSPDGALRDADEAVQCFRKAAGLGHAGAQMELGKLCENGQGVPKDFAEAMRWYRKAAEQKEPHAMCRIGDLYHDGRGVRADLDEAARWYRVEAEGNCAMAQWKLGSILDNSLGTDAALPWYRRAAEGGLPVAQAKLGDLLSDGLFVKPDPVEACQWLSLAAGSGDRLSVIRLGRLKTKMTLKQLEEAAQRAAAVTQRLEIAEKAPKARTR